MLIVVAMSLQNTEQQHEDSRDINAKLVVELLIHLLVRHYLV